MRTLVDIEAQDIEALDVIAEQSKQSRASLIRQAIADFLNKKKAATIDDAFGLWGKHKIDGLAFQNKIRSEW